MDPITAPEAASTPEVHKGSDSVRIVVFEDEKCEKFWILTELDDEENWKLPGGKFESKADGEIETPREAVEREAMEEIGLSPDEAVLTHAETLKNDDGSSLRYIYYAFAGAEKLEKGAEVDRMELVTAATLPPTRNMDHILAAVEAAKKAHDESKAHSIIDLDITGLIPKL